MKRSRLLALVLVFLMLFFLSSCASAEERMAELEEEGRNVFFQCDETLYYSKNRPHFRYLRYCGDVVYQYNEDSVMSGAGLIGVLPTYFPFGDNETVVFISDSSRKTAPVPFWGNYIHLICGTTEEKDFLPELDSEDYASYKLLPSDQSCYYPMGETLSFDPSNVPEEYFLSWQLSYGPSRLKELEGYTILGCDKSGNFGVEIAKLVKDESRNVYFYFVYDHSVTEQSMEKISGRALSKAGMAVLNNFLDQTEPVIPTQELWEGSLEDALARLRITYTLAYVAVGMLLAATLIFAFRRPLKEWLDLWLYRIKVVRQEKYLEPGSDKDLRPLDLKLTKEELARGPDPAEDEGDSDEHNRRFCPVCGARCDWTALRCAACGAELVMHGKKLVRVDAMRQSPGKGGYGSYVMDLNAVSYTDFLRYHGPKRLNKSATRFTVWYVFLASMVLFSTVIVYGDLLLLTQSALLSLFAFVPGAALLVLAILYYYRRNLAPPIVFAVYSGFSVVMSLISLFSGSLTSGTPLNSVVSVIVCFAEIACHCIISGFAISRTVEMRNEYKDFKLRRGNYK